MEQSLAVKDLISSSPEEGERSCRSTDLIRHHSQTEDEDCLIQSVSHTKALALSKMCSDLILCHVISPSGLFLKQSSYGF